MHPPKKPACLGVDDLLPWHGLLIVIEHFAGAVRHPNKPWAREIPSDWRGYGYFALDGVVAPDGDPIDVILGPASPYVGPFWVVQQLNPFRARAPHRATWTTQPKVMLGFRDETEVLQSFDAMWPWHRDLENLTFFAEVADLVSWLRSYPREVTR